MKTRTMGRKSRGQAAVELSLLGIIVVPTTLYVLFLDDLLRFKLDQQEAMVTTVWDLGVLDYEASGNSDVSGAAQGFNRLAFGDHNVVDSRYDDANIINTDQNHHMGVGAHQCWLIGGAKNQVTCGNLDKTVGASYFPDLAGGAQTRTQSAAQTGGFYSCTGRIGVINNWLPPTTLSQFSQEKLTRTAYHFGSYGANQVHQTGQSYGDNDRNVYHFPADTYGMVVDTWAMTTDPAVSPDSNGGTLYKRVDASYSAPSVMILTNAVKIGFGGLLTAKKLINPLVLLDMGSTGDDVTTPQISFTKNLGPTAGPYNPFWASAWRDFSANRVEGTYNARQKSYMGLPAPP